MIQQVILTESEQILWEQISFSMSDYTPSFDEVKKSIEPAFELLKSLVSRNAINSIRLQYFEEPELNIGGRGKSRHDTFIKNGTEDEDIFRHPHFHKYLRYFILGPDIPSSDITEFNKLVIYDDIESMCKLACKQVRSNSNNLSSIAEEYYKLCLELELSETMARIVRDKVKKIK